MLALLFLSLSSNAAAMSDGTAPEYLTSTLSAEELNTRHFEQGEWRPFPISLGPAQWIWMPSSRTLCNTFILFRKEFTLDAAPERAIGWISADSRYRLTVNGERVQWGPAPFDPRYQEADPFDITRFLKPGKNVIGVEVLHYGLGDGTWPAGKPGMIFNATIEGGGKSQQLVSDASWLAYLDRAHAPGRPKRWYLRALQEEFDARLHPFGWDSAEFMPDAQWIPALRLDCPPDKPSACSRYDGNDLIDRVNPERASLRAREIPLIAETEVPVKGLADSGQLKWLRDPRDWFEMRVPNSFELVRAPVAQAQADGAVVLPAAGENEGVYATFEFTEQLVGWPRFVIDAPEGTIVELMVQESHDPEGPAWLDTHLFAWTRFICREGANRFEPFDYESFRWVQLHVRNASRPVTISGVCARRRMFDWPNPVQVRCAEPALQRLFDATANTLNNSAIDTCVDGMGRERQQYSGDCGPQLFAIRYGLGETRLPQRFLRTFSEGQGPDGYFLDCWPAFDRLARVMQKQVDAAYWGPILDHGVGFAFDCWNPFLETGDRDGVAEAYPRLVRFADYLTGMRGEDGLQPVENLGIPTVWIDHDAYKQPRHKQCAFNLYTAAMLRHALAPLARVFGEEQRAADFEKRSDEILAATQRVFWSPEQGIFVVNRPWAAEEKEIRLCDRSLATAILYGQCPGGETAASLSALADCPPEMGFSYPANAYWRYWALAKMGRIDVVLKDFRERWATMGSVKWNNTLQENWTARPDSTSVWSHCPVCPLYLLFMDIAGIRPSAPGFTRCVIRPQLGDIGDLDLTAHTVRGAFHFIAKRENGVYRVSIDVPPGCQAELELPEDVSADFKVLSTDRERGLKRFEIPSQAEFELPIGRS